jgi:hypothetical protein
MAVTLAGCNRFPDNGLQIAAMLPPDDDCSVTAEQDLRLARGRYDLAVVHDYLIIPLLQNYLIRNGLEFQSDQNNLQVENFEITILLPDGSKPDFGETLPNPYRVTTSVVLPANADPGTFTEDAALAVGIPATYQAELSGYSSILLDIRAIGTTFGGFTQRSATFRWPVDLCMGCLENCDPDAAEDVANSCFPGQDTWQYCLTPP